MRGTGRVVFTATLLLIAGVVNVVYGIGALDNANVLVHDQRFVFDDLNQLGWVLIIIGAIQLIGGIALMTGNAFGRFIGIVGASLGALNALLSIGGSYPWWSLGVFFLCIYIIHGLFIFGEDRAAQGV